MEFQKRRDILLAMTPYSPWRAEGVRRFARKAGWNLRAAPKPIAIYAYNSYNAAFLARVCLDNRAIGRMAAEHFAERNFRHAAWFSTHWIPTHAARFASFSEVWTSLPGGREPPSRHVLMEEIPVNRWNDSRAVGRWFASLLRNAPRQLAVG